MLSIFNNLSVWATIIARKRINLISNTLAVSATVKIYYRIFWHHVGFYYSNGTQEDFRQPVSVRYRTHSVRFHHTDNPCMLARTFSILYQHLIILWISIYLVWYTTCTSVFSDQFLWTLNLMQGLSLPHKHAYKFTKSESSVGKSDIPVIWDSCEWCPFLWNGFSCKFVQSLSINQETNTLMLTNHITACL